MKILVATDSFKNSLSSLAIGNIFGNTLLNVKALPLADGGEGSLEVLNSVYPHFERVSIKVKNALLEDKETYYLFDKKKNKAYIETALICGLEEFRTDQLSIMESSSFGIGQVLLDAYQKNIESIAIFLGGTASNDGGLGLLSALGYTFFDDQNNALKPITKNLEKVSSLKESKTDMFFESCELISDVTNILLGNEGATYVFGKQKGAKHDELAQIEKGMTNYANQVSKYFKSSHIYRESSGAAGGIPFGMMQILNCSVVSGIEYLSNLMGLVEAIDETDIVITGEGKIDSQSFYGKTISYVIKHCRELNKPYILICGINEVTDYHDPLCLGIFQMVDFADSPEASINDAENVLEHLIKNKLKDVLGGITV